MSLSQLSRRERVAVSTPIGDDMEPNRPQRRDASFLVRDVACRAYIYEPGAGVPRPAACIVMAHGLGGTRDASLAPYAERFAAAGFYVVLFDYRHLGASDGQPRQLILPERQLEDWQAAIDFARLIPGVDARRIGLWGTSLSGGHVIMAAARDKGVGAISAQCPMLDGSASARMAIWRSGIAATLRMFGAAVRDTMRAAFGRSPYYVPLAARDGELAVMASDKALAGCLAIVPEGWRNQVAARILFRMPHYRPLRHAREVQCPTLLVACADDSIVSAKAAGEAATMIGSKARLVVLPIDHFDIYHGQWFDRACAEQVAFFGEKLQSEKVRANAT